MFTSKGQKKKFTGRLGGYHGITIASGSLTGLPINHKGFYLPLPQVKHVSCPHHDRFAGAGESEEQFFDRLAVSSGQPPVLLPASNLHRG